MTYDDYKTPKTRSEKKGRDKESSSGPYSSKHVRISAALAEKRAAMPPPSSQPKKKH